MTTLRKRIAIDSRYLLLSLPTALVSFPLVVAGVSAGLGAAVAFVGLPVLAATAGFARSVADAERASLPGVLGHPVARPRYREAPVWAGWFRRMMNPLASGQAVMDLLHVIIAFPLAVAGSVVAAAWWLGTLAGLTFPLYGWIIAGIPGAVETGLPGALGFADSPALFVVWNTVLGLLFAITLPPVLRGAALVRASLAELMLTRPALARPAAVPHIVDQRLPV
ncbi:sensor domain-containing protein [Nonomuraea sp. MCN248]|uniref:Sensor domain-containing protein n=1 Tax=Nonomuraea corallina TaxID=2989783 RepID=A0ABT4S542_9ACTN|nr:sensor domain-containing protein [Nonomuraea corallina]MDA0632317.1 sensor domain-containing protein [Nonomuraea corallina]